MKIAPLAQGTGVPAQTTGPQVNTSKIARAKAIAAGQQPVEQTGDVQADRAQQSLKRIKMRTQVSTNRHDLASSSETSGNELTQAEGKTGATDEIEDIPASNLSQNPLHDTSEQAEVVEETKPLSPQFAALAKAKRALQVKERELAQREEALKTQTPSGGEDLLAKLKSNPLRVLQEAGVSYDQLTEAILANPSGSSELLELRAEIQALKEGMNNQLSERDNLAEKQVLTQMKREADLLTTQGEAYEAIREAKAQQAVVDLVHRTWKQTGEIMDIEEAAELVETQLIEEALPFARLSKIQKRLTPEQQAYVDSMEGQPNVPVTKPGTKVMRTLTNRDSARPISDRRARAIAAFTGSFKRG